MRSSVAAVVLVLAACMSRPSRTAVAVSADQARAVRVALHLGVSRVALSATGQWRLGDTSGESTLMRGGDAWIVQRDGANVRATRADGSTLPIRSGPLFARPESGESFLTVDGKRYRGDIVVLVRDTGVAVVNRLPIESYLRGVVPLEIGNRSPEERAAVQAQAVAARSFTYSRLRDPSAAYDLRASTLDQVYGGVDVERALSDEAIASTRGLVLMYGARPVGAPYFSSCGGRTAAASEVWRSPDEPHLVSVSDTNPITGRSYCEDAPRAIWNRAFDRPELTRVLERYLSSYVALPAGGPGAVRSVEVDGTTSSGRVRAVIVSSDRGRYVLRGNDMRFVLRAPGGEILPSTYFSLDAVTAPDGRVSRVTLRGRGNGHGVGMCQWGAIGRARAGQDFRAILRTYYPGTSVDALQR
ncbi:MAG TPA: SpoIID/LytB domain-containing protein [Gemmatimonadaceae bacterium]|nr:SpoIID/LytB domain-containing protein [Gemmatimonadaceae bacterium]